MCKSRVKEGKFFRGLKIYDPVLKNLPKRKNYRNIAGKCHAADGLRDARLTGQGAKAEITLSAASSPYSGHEG